MNFINAMCIERVREIVHNAEGRWPGKHQREHEAVRWMFAPAPNPVITQHLSELFICKLISTPALQIVKVFRIQTDSAMMTARYEQQSLTQNRIFPPSPVQCHWTLNKIWNTWTEKLIPIDLNLWASKQKYVKR